MDNNSQYLSFLISFVLEIDSALFSAFQTENTIVRVSVFCIQFKFFA